MADEIIIDDNGGVGGSLRVTAISAELSKLKNLDATIFLSAGSLQYLVYKHGSAERNRSAIPILEGITAAG
jgi:hypothetical protein